MKRIVNIIVMLSAFFVLSCKEKEHLLIETRNFMFEESSFDTIKGMNTGISVIGATNIYSGYGLLFVESNNPQEQLAVYDANNFQHILALCLQGRAKNEFINPTNYCKQISVINNELKIPIRNNGLETKIVNVSKSLDEKRTVVEDVRDCINQNKGCELYLSNYTKKFVYHRAWTNDPRTDDYEIPRFYVEDEKQTEIKVYGSLISDHKYPIIPSFIYSGNMRVKPNESNAVFYCVNMNYLIVFDLNDNKSFAIHKSDELSYNESLPDDLTTLRLGYGDVCLTDDFIIALAPNGAQDDYDEDVIMPLLLVFDWEGDFLFGRTFDRRIYNISIDESNKRLFGFERSSETVYSYDLSSLYKK